MGLAAMVECRRRSCSDKKGRRQKGYQRWEGEKSLISESMQELPA